MKVTRRKFLRICRQAVEESPEFADVAAPFLFQDSFQKLDFLAYQLNHVPHDDPAHIVTEMIEALIAHPPSKEDWVKGEKETIIGRNPFYPAPGSRLHLFNELAKANPFFLDIKGYEKEDGTIQISATHSSFPIFAAFAPDSETRDKIIKNWSYTTAATLELLWEVYFDKMGLERLKRCSQCNRWFVDRTRNMQKERCSSKCTWQWWSWSKRKEEGHNQPIKKTKSRKKRK